MDGVSFIPDFLYHLFLCYLFFKLIADFIKSINSESSLLNLRSSMSLIRFAFKLSKNYETQDNSNYNKYYIE